MLEVICCKTHSSSNFFRMNNSRMRCRWDWYLYYVLCATNMKAQICQSKKCSTNQRNFLLPLVALSLPTALNNLHTKNTSQERIYTHIHLSLNPSIYPRIHQSIFSLSFSGFSCIHSFLILSLLSFSSRNVSGYVCNHGSPSGERDTASPRGRYGERPQRDSVWRYIWKNTTCWPATAHDVTTGIPQYKCRREDTSSASSSEACVRSMAQSPGDAVSRSPLGEPWLHT